MHSVDFKGSRTVSVRIFAKSEHFWKLANMQYWRTYIGVNWRTCKLANIFPGCGWRLGRRSPEKYAKGWVDVLENCITLPHPTPPTKVQCLIDCCVA